jgi:hypothetical protein
MPLMVLCTQIKGNDLIEQKTRTTKKELPYKIIRKKIRKKEQERKETDDEPFNRQEV